jgi:hypothetical protein
MQAEPVERITTKDSVIGEATRPAGDGKGIQWQAQQAKQ